MTGARILGRYDAAAVRGFFAAAGVLRVLEERGFTALTVTVESEGGALPHTRLFGCKNGRRHLLLDAILLEAEVPAAFFGARGHAVLRPMRLVLVYWLREEDPTAAFCAERPALPLQLHPGLGVLRRAFNVIVRMANDLGKDGVASHPKLFHDAAIFHHSRLFLFLDGREEGRFEALLRDLRALALGDASLALVGGCVRDAAGAVERWRPGLQVFPLSAPLVDYFHSLDYARAVEDGLAASAFVVDVEALQRTREMARRPVPRRERRLVARVRGMA